MSSRSGVSGGKLTPVFLVKVEFWGAKHREVSLKVEFKAKDTRGRATRGNIWTKKRELGGAGKAGRFQDFCLMWSALVHNYHEIRPTMINSCRKRGKYPRKRVEREGKPFGGLNRRENVPARCTAR